MKQTAQCVMRIIINFKTISGVGRDLPSTIIQEKSLASRGSPVLEEIFRLISDKINPLPHRHLWWLMRSSV